MDGIQRLSNSEFQPLSSPEPIISQPSQLPRQNSELDYSENNIQLAQALQTQVTSLFSNGDVNEECSSIPDGGLTSSEGLGHFIQTLAQTMVNAGLGGVLSVSECMHWSHNVCIYKITFTDKVEYDIQYLKYQPTIGEYGLTLA